MAVAMCVKVKCHVCFGRQHVAKIQLAAWLAQDMHAAHWPCPCCLPELCTTQCRATSPWRCQLNVHIAHARSPPTSHTPQLRSVSVCCLQAQALRRPGEQAVAGEHKDGAQHAAVAHYETRHNGAQHLTQEVDGSHAFVWRERVT